ncbi:MAG: VanZ family protein, partial [Desulfobacterales bacterium]|nr:VanZ family protein [Desulfobacterales bacterium]
SAIVALSVAASVLFGISDEFHQSFVPSRTADIRDLVFDFLGSVVGSGICWLFYAKSAKIHPRVTLR